MGNIEKSPLVVAQEKEIKELDVKIKKTKTSIKALKTRKKNVEKEFKERESEVFNQSAKMTADLQQTRAQIIQTLKVLTKDRRFSKDNQTLFKELLEEFEDSSQMFEEMDDLLEGAHTASSPEDERAKERQFFKSFEAETSKEEKKKIRSLYLQLSREFHPDSIQDEKKEASALALQQQIIQAYEANDYQALLDIQVLHSQMGLMDAGVHDADILSAKIKTLNVQLEQLTAQKERLSEELKAFRQSELGQRLSATKSAEREGYSLGEISGLDQLEMALEEIRKMGKALENTKAKGHITADLEELLQPVEAHPLMSLLMEGADLFFDDDEYEEGELNPNPAFPVGTLVEISDNFTDVEDWDDCFPIFGTVESTLISFYNNEPIYNILLHSKSLNALPDHYYFAMQDEFGEPIDQLTEIPEVYLKLAPADIKPESRDTQIKAFKTAWINTFLKDVLPQFKEAIREAILSRPEPTIEQAWKAYLANTITFPQPLMTASRLAGNWKKGETLVWLGMVEVETPELPTIIQVRKDKLTSVRAAFHFFKSADPDIELLIRCDQILDDNLGGMYF